MVKARRNSFYVFIVLVLIAPKVVEWAERKGLLIQMPYLFSEVATVAIVILGIYLGYRVANIRCFQCGNKLAMGQFFHIKNVRCWGCGFGLPRN